MKYVKCDTVDQILSKMDYSYAGPNSIPHVPTFPTYNVTIHESKYMGLDMVCKILEDREVGKAYRYTDKIVIMDVLESEVKEILKDFGGIFTIEYEKVMPDGRIISGIHSIRREEYIDTEEC